MELERYFAEFGRRDWATDDPSGTVRVAVVGVGAFARSRALPAIADTGYCEPTVLVSGSEDTEAVARDVGVDTVLSYDEYLDGRATDRYDAAYVATPNATHGRYAMAAADRGKHVLCEKPLEVDSDAARELVEACRSAEVTLMTAYRLQLEPTVRRTRELLEDGVIGDVVQLHAGFSHPLLAYSGTDDWRLDPELAGGGALVDLGIYPLNAIRFLLGRDPTSVAARTHSVSDPFSAVDEHVAFQLEFQGPITASCTASFNAHPTSTLEIIGTEGKISISSPFGGVVPHDIYVESGDVGMEYRGRPIDEVREEFAYFGYCLLTDTRPEPDGIDGLRDVTAIESTYEAAASDRRVDVPSPQLGR